MENTRGNYSGKMDFSPGKKFSAPCGQKKRDFYSHGVYGKPGSKMVAEKKNPKIQKNYKYPINPGTKIKIHPETGSPVSL
jgi:hypothetical protein